MSEKRIYRIFERENKWLRCKDVIEEAKKDDISTTTVYRTLRKMVAKGILEKDRTEWKKSRYRLNPQAMPKDLLRILELKTQALELINSHIREVERQGYVQFIEALFKWVGILSVFNALQQIKTGKPYDQITKHYLSYIGGLQAPLRRRILAPLFTSLEDLGTIGRLSNPTEALGEIPQCKPIMESLENALKTAHPKEVDLLKQLYEPSKVSR